MNIVTYACPVGIRPERRWALSLYRGTRTCENFARRRRGVLQLLRTEHGAATWALGGRSGADSDKARACAGLGLEWEPCGWGDELVLPRCAAYFSPCGYSVETQAPRRRRRRRGSFPSRDVAATTPA